VQTYKTLFVNETESMVRCFDNGNYLVLLSSNWRVTLESANPLTDFARYASVKWTRASSLPLLETRPNWIEPSRGRWTTEFLNIDGKELEERDIGGGQKVHLQVGIPVLRAVPLSSRFIFAQRVEIRKTYGKEKSSRFPGYIAAVEKLGDIFEFRSEKDKAQILIEIKEVGEL